MLRPMQHCKVGRRSDIRNMGAWLPACAGHESFASCPVSRAEPGTIYWYGPGTHECLEVPPGNRRRRLEARLNWNCASAASRKARSLTTTSGNASFPLASSHCAACFSTLDNSRRETHQRKSKAANSGDTFGRTSIGKADLGAACHHHDVVRAIVTLADRARSR